MNERVVLYFQRCPIPPVTQVNFLWFPTTNLFVAFVPNFPADPNVTSKVWIDLTFHFQHMTLVPPQTRNMNLNRITNYQYLTRFLSMSVWVRLLWAKIYNKTPTKDGDSCICWELIFSSLTSCFDCRKMAKGRAWVSSCILSTTDIISSNLPRYFSPMTAIDDLLCAGIPEVWRLNLNVVLL